MYQNYLLRASLPSRRSYLYQECLNILLATWNIQAENLPLSGVYTILEKIAFELQVNQGQFIDYETIFRIIQDVKTNLSLSFSIEDVIAGMVSRIGILREVSPKHFSFLHITFQEYLTARHLVVNDYDIQFLAERLGDDRWHEVTLFYCGLVGGVTAILNRTLSSEQLREREKYLFAGRCIIESSRVASDLRSEVLQGIAKQILINYDDEKIQEDLLKVAREFSGPDISLFLLQDIQNSSAITRLRILKVIEAIGQFSNAIESKLQSLENDASSVQINGEQVVIGRLADLYPKI
jgi:predicted NACHT family NTPase